MKIESVGGYFFNEEGQRIVTVFLKSGEGVNIPVSNYMSNFITRNKDASNILELIKKELNKLNKGK